MKDNIEIKAPEGYKFKEIKDGNVVFEPIQTDYNYVIEQLGLGDCRFVSARCYSERQTDKLRSINKLLNVAKYLNGDWKPDFKNDNDKKWHIYLDITQKPETNYDFMLTKSFVYFKTEELAQQAVEILGEDTIKLALTTDY